MTTNHARANDAAALRRLVEPVRLKCHDALKILAHDDETQGLLVNAITTYQGVTSYTSALQVIKAEPRYRMLCEVRGWSLAMICPECPRGCGCETNCTGWRHRDYETDSFDDEYDEYDEYGFEEGSGYGEDDEDDHPYDGDYDKGPLGLVRRGLRARCRNQRRRLL